MRSAVAIHQSVHEDLRLDEPRVGVARHPVRDHAREGDDGLGHLPVGSVKWGRRRPVNFKLVHNISQILR